MNKEIMTTDSDGTLRVRGTLSIMDVRSLREMFLDSLCSAEHVIFEIEEIEDISFACLQMLCSACRTAFVMEKRFSVVPMNHKRFQKIFKHSGYLISDKCNFIRGKCCIKAGLEDAVKLKADSADSEDSD